MEEEGAAGASLVRTSSFKGLQRSSSFAGGNRRLGGQGERATEITPLVSLPLDTVDPRKPPPMESGFSFEDVRQPIKAPSLLIWIWPALFCALAYALYNIFIKKGSASIHPILGGVILQIVAALFGTLLLVLIVVQDGMDTLEFDRSGILWSILAGVSVGSAEMLSFFVMGMGVQATQAIPIVIGGSVMFGCVLGAVWLNEILAFQGWMGVALVVLGIVLVATDPSSRLGE
jgi:transporter family protein